MTAYRSDPIILDDVDRSGVYGIFNISAGKVYIGSAVNISRRYREHQRKLMRGNHHSPHLQRAWNKMGPGSFMFKALRFVDKSDLIKEEQDLMNFFQSAWDEAGYNICPTAGNCIGRKLSDEAKKRIADKHRGRKLSEDHRAAISAGGTGRRVTEKTLVNMRKAQQGFGGGNARLTESDVLDIRSSFAAGTTQAVLAERHGINRGYVSLIVTRKRWRHI